MKKCKCEFFEYYALLLFFIRSYLAIMAKSNPTEKQIDVEFQATLKHGPTLHPNIRSNHLEVFRQKVFLKGTLMQI